AGTGVGPAGAGAGRPGLAGGRDPARRPRLGVPKPTHCHEWAGRGSTVACTVQLTLGLTPRAAAETPIQAAHEFPPPGTADEPKSASGTEIDSEYVEATSVSVYDISRRANTPAPHGLAAREHTLPGGCKAGTDGLPRSRAMAFRRPRVAEQESG